MMAEFTLADILDALEEAGLNATGAKEAYFGIMAEAVLEAVYLHDHRGASKWYDENYNALDWRDAFSVRTFLDFIEDRLSRPSGSLKLGNQKVPDICTLDGLVKEIYEIKPSEKPLQFNGPRAWKPSRKNKTHFQQKVKAVTDLFSKYGLGPISKGTLFDPGPAPRPLIGLTIDDFKKEDITQLLGLESDPEVYESLEQLGKDILNYAIPGALTLMGHSFEFKRVEDGLLLWRLARTSNEEVEVTEPLKRLIPVAFEQGLERLVQRSKEILKDVEERLLPSLALIAHAMQVIGPVIVESLLLAAGAVVVIGLAMLLVKGAPVLAAGALGLLLIYSMTSSQDAIAAPIMGIAFEKRVPVGMKSVLRRSVGAGGSNNPRDTAYIQMLLNVYKNRTGQEGILVTGACLPSTRQAIKDFTREQCGKEVAMIRPGSPELAVLHVRCLESLLFGDSVAKLTVMQPAKICFDMFGESIRKQVDSFAGILHKLLADIYHAMPNDQPDASVGVPDGIPEALFVRFGNVPNARRLLKEIKVIRNDVSPMPAEELEIYKKLAELTDAQLNDVNSILTTIRNNVSAWKPRTQWSAKPWPDMTRSIKFDWKYTTAVIHHSGDGILNSKDTATKVEDYHRSREGYADIGYHFVIHKDGTVHEGRSLIFEGAHVYWVKDGVVQVNNQHKIGILVCGDFQHQWYDATDDEIDPRQIESVRRLVASLRSEFPGLVVKGHGELKPTACPGEQLKKVLDQIRS